MDFNSLPAVFVCSTSEETIELGKNIGKLLKKGDIIALFGPLGAGKTCFTKGIASGIGITEEITSPTYTIVSEYEAGIPFYHIDAYRLRGNDDFINIGGEEILSGEGISVIEWSERISDFIPLHAYKVDIEIIEENKRLFRFNKQAFAREKQ